MYGVDTSSFLESKRNGTRIVICTGAYANIVDGVSRTLNRLVKDLNDGSDGDNYKVSRSFARISMTSFAHRIGNIVHPSIYRQQLGVLVVCDCHR